MSPSHDKPVLEPGPPNFSDVEGAPAHHPGAATPPGAGPNPTPLPADKRKPDRNATAPGASTVPGAGPNPTASD